VSKILTGHRPRIMYQSEVGTEDYLISTPRHDSCSDHRPAMKAIASILIILISLARSAAAQELTDEARRVAIRKHRNHIIGVYVSRLLTERLERAAACENHEGDKWIETFRTLKRFPDTESETLALMTLYLETYSAQGPCSKILADGEANIAKWERTYFLPLERTLYASCINEVGSPDRACRDQVQRILSEIDPHCAGKDGPTFTGSIEKTACYAADHLIAEAARKDDPYQNKLELLINRLVGISRYVWAQAPPEKRKIDIWNVYKADQGNSIDEKMRFFALLAMLSSSSTSLASHVDGFKEYYWRQTLFETKSPQMALNEYHDLSERRDRFAYFLDWAKANKITLTFGSRNVTKLRDHDYTAAFLGCYYRDRGRPLWSTLPRVLGVSYKSLDFFFKMGGVTNFREMSQNLLSKDYRDRLSRFLKADYENWKEDTDRYKTGTQWGHDLCANP